MKEVERETPGSPLPGVESNATPVAEGDTIPAIPRLRPVAGRCVFVRWAEYLSYVVALVTAVIAFVMSVGLIGCILIQVFWRYILNAPSSWTDEMAIFLFAWSTLLFASVAVRERIHVRFGVLANALPSTVAKILDRATMILIAGFGLVLIYLGNDILDLVWGDLSPAIHYPLQLLYIAIPIQGALMAVHAMANVFIGPEASDHGDAR